ncbi:MAG: peptidase dimerization domain-containing protein [Woeseiaceae bacterium]|nr:peptidase dimerization domain-containing protein [Woeseiaceae bacterium]
MRDGTFTCASRGLRVELTGRSAHAAQPETGNNPAAAMARLVLLFGDLPAALATDGELMFATVVGANVGGRNFGVVPDRAELCVTLRSETDVTMARLVEWCEARARKVASEHGLELSLAYQDVFDATVNAPGAVETVRRASDGMPLAEAEVPFRWSEDFGRFTRVADGAFFGLGAGEGMPALHNDNYDFPDELVGAGSRVFLRIVDACLARPG